MSNIVHISPSNMPICDPKPSESSMVKNRTDQIGARGNSTIACVKTMNANPVPPAAYQF